MFLSLALVAAAAFTPASILAQTLSTSAHYRSLTDHSFYEIQADGTYVEEVTKAVSPMGPSDAQQLSQVLFPFQVGVLEIDVIEAYTLKPDGRKIDVPPERIVTQGLPATADSTAFSDMQVKALLYPDVTETDQVVYRVRRRLVKPPIPAKFDVIHHFPDSIAHGDARIRFKYPKSFPLRYQVVGLQEVQSSEEGDFLLKEWTYSNEKTIPEEKDSVDSRDRSPRLVASSLTGWDDVARAIQTLMEEKQSAREDIRKLADEITKGCVSERESAEAIYQWVGSRIRYVLLYLGANGYTPNDSASILNNRYGDCKDKVKILCELLAAKGIDCTPVLVSAGNSFFLPEVSTLRIFNHMIAYLPGLDVYLDPAPGIYPFGVLSEIEADKPVLHTRHFQGIRHTPPVMVERAVVRTTSEIFASEDGSAHGQTTVWGWNEAAAALRAAMAIVGNAPERRQAVVMSSLNIEHLVGDGELSFDEPQGQTPDYGYRVNFNLKNYLRSTGKGGRVPLCSGMFSILAIWRVLSPLNAPEEKLNHVAMICTIQEEMIIQLPDSCNIERLPGGVEFSNAVGSYKSTYENRDHGIRVVRRLVQQYPHACRTPEEGVAFREISNAARSDLSTALYFQKRVTDQPAQ